MFWYIFLLLMINCYKAGSSHQVTCEGPLSSNEIWNFAHRTRADPTERTAERTVEGDNNYNSSGIVGKLQAERTIQYHTRCSGALKKIYWLPSCPYTAVTSCYETAGGPVLEQDCDYTAGQTDATKAFFVLKTSYASTVHK